MISDEERREMAQITADAFAVPLEMVMQSTTVRPMDEDEPIAPGKREVTPIPKPKPKPKRGPYVWKRKRLKMMSDKRREQIPEREQVRKAVLRRDGEKCRIAPFLPDLPCYGRMTVHHLWKAGQGGPYTEANLVAACAFHNDWVEDNPEPAKALGLTRGPSSGPDGNRDDEPTEGHAEEPTTPILATGNAADRGRALGAGDDVRGVHPRGSDADGGGDGDDGG